MTKSQLTPSTPARLITIPEFYTMTLSLPESALSPNARVHWSKKQRANRNARIASEMITRQAIGREPMPRWERASIRACAFLRQGRARPDPDNFIASLKGVIDGFEDAGLLANDRDVVLWPPLFLTAIDGEELRMIVTRLDNPNEAPI